MASTLLPVAVEQIVGLFPYQDSVAVYYNYKQVFQDARIIKATLSQDSQVMKHPLENGANVIDHRIILPREIELSIILTPKTYRDTYNLINDFFYNAKILSVQMRTGSVYNMIISSMPHEETTDVYDTVTIALKLTEILIANTQTSTTKVNPRNPKNANNKPRGEQTTKQVPPDSTLYNFGTKASDYAHRIFG